MKKYLLLLSIATVCALSATHAQIKKGATFLGGDIGGNTVKTKSADTTYSKQNGIYISPVFGKAIRENLILGFDLVTNIYNNDNAASVGFNHKQRMYGGGIFLRKYKQLGSSGFSIFAQGRFGVGFGKTEQENHNYVYSYEEKNFSTTLSAYPGLSYTISRKLQLETGFNNLIAISYNNTRKTENNGLNVKNFKTNGFEVNSSLDNLSSIYLGFRLLLN